MITIIHTTQRAALPLPTDTFAASLRSLAQLQSSGTGGDWLNYMIILLLALVTALSAYHVVRFLCHVRYRHAVIQLERSPSEAYRGCWEHTWRNVALAVAAVLALAASYGLYLLLIG